MKPRGQQFLDRLRDEVMVGDGAVGTQLSRLDVGTDISYEQLNLTRPDIVQSIMREYLDVGAQLIETNSFCANYPKQKRFGLESQVREMAKRAAQLGREVAGENRFVAGSVGPLARKKQDLDEYTDDEIHGFFRESMEALAEGGVDVLMLETFTYLKELELALSAAQGLDLPIICQMAYGEGGTTELGVPTEKAVQRLVSGGAHVVGSNCRSGPHLLISVVERQAKVTDLPISVFPNAGYAEQQDGRYVYGASPRYFGDRARDLVEAGANLIGGCCGTTPEHIKALVEAIRGMKPQQRQKVGKKVHVTPGDELLHRVGGEKFMEFFRRPEPFVAVEIEPPRSLDVKPAIEGARKMASAGADALNVPDNTLATVKMDNVIFSRLLRERVELPVILHLTCRDKNTIALQSELLGAQMIGMEAILAITGDPASIGDQPGATSVYDINSIGLVEMIASLNRGVTAWGATLEKPTDFAIGVAVSPNVSGVKGLEGAMFKLKKKILAGAQFAESQPIYDVTILRNFARAMKVVGLPVCVGQMPIVSKRNADFFHNEVPGVKIPQEVRNRFEGLSKSEGEEEGMRIAKELIDVAFEEGIRNFYLIPPLRRFELAAELITYIKRRA